MVEFVVLYVVMMVFSSAIVVKYIGIQTIKNNPWPAIVAVILVIACYVAVFYLSKPWTWQ